jgi:predicted dehydrogenase
MTTSDMPDTTESAGSSRRLRVAIAGCHRMLNRTPGSHNWGAAFAAVPETEVVAVYDRGAETREAFRACWGPVALFEDFRRMLEEVRPDLLCVATRQTQHATQIQAAVAAGVRGVLCDKPLVTSMGEAKGLLGACREAGVPLAFGLDRRWSARYRAAREAIAEGLLGRVETVVAWGLPNLINHGCHWYDVALALAGDPEVEWVSGQVDPLPDEPPDSRGPRPGRASGASDPGRGEFRRRLDPAGTAQVQLANGVALYVTPSGRPGPAFEVLGDRGRLVLLNDARASSLWLAEGSPAALRETPFQLPTDSTIWPTGPAAVRDLVGAVRAGGRTACDLDEAGRATLIGFAVHESGRQGGRRITPDEIDPALRVESFPWGNE